jgi:hypothetical protein
MKYSVYLRFKSVSTETSNNALLLINPALLISIKQMELSGQFYEPDIHTSEETSLPTPPEKTMDSHRSA